MTDTFAQSPAGNRLRLARNSVLLLVATVFVFSVFVNILMLTGPLFMLQVYDRVLASRSEETLVALILLVGLLYGIMGLLDYARGRIAARIGARIQTALDQSVFEDTLRQAIQPSVRSQPAVVLKDIGAIQMLCMSPVLLALMDLPWAPLFLAAIFMFHPMLGWLAVIGIGMLICAALLNQILTKTKISDAQVATAHAHAFSEQSRQGCEIVCAQGMQPAITKRWSQMRQHALAQSILASDRNGSFVALTKALRLFLQSAMLALGAYYVLQGEMTAGAMIAGSILLGRALAPLEQSIGQWNVVQQARASWMSLEKFLDSTLLDTRRSLLPVPDAELWVKDLAIAPPGAKTTTLRKVSFSLSPGHALGIVGKSGSGKSSIAKALLGLWTPITGEVRLGGATLDQYDPVQRGRFIGYLPQQVCLFSGTVAENISRFLPGADIGKVIAAAKAAKAHELILSLKHGYETFIDGNESLLSGGQKQRIALARALFGDPVLLILDEPSSALDAQGCEALNQVVSEFKANQKSVIIMTHRPMAISECDTLMVIEQGQVSRIGPRDKVLSSMVQNAETIKQFIGQAAS